MADRIGSALAHLNSRLKSHAGTTATYRRGSSYVTITIAVESTNISPLTTLAAAVADRDFTQPSPEHADHPFSFCAEDLILDGSLTRPEEGDTIDITDSNSEVRSYRLAPSLDGERAWKFMTGYEAGPEARIRINTRLMAVEPE